MKRINTFFIAASISFAVILIMSINTVSAEPIGWEEDVRLTNDPSGSHEPEIEADLFNNVHVVWTDLRDGVAEVYYKKYDGNGWSDDLRLDNDENGHSMNPVIADDSQNNLHVVFADNRRPDNLDEIYYMRYDGNEWSTPERITINANMEGIIDYGPEIVIDSQNNLYVFWSADRSPINDYEALYYVMYDGQDWSSIIQITNNTRDHLVGSVVVDSNDNIHLVYTDRWPTGTSGYYFSIYYQKYDGNDWSSPLKIDNSDIAGDADIMVDVQNNIHITWADARSGNYEIYYSKLDSNGNIIIDNKRKTWNPEAPGYRGVWRKASAMDSQDNVHVTWHNQEGDNTEEFTVMYLKLDNNGDILINKTNLTIADLNNENSPNISIDLKDRIHMVFMDDRDGNQEIYYKATYGYDLSVFGDDIQFSPSLPGSGETVRVNATIHNNGGYLTNGTVYFYIDSIDELNLIGSVFISIPFNEYENISVDWSAVLGNHTIWVEIELDDGTLETNLTNNIANKTIIVNGPPTITVTTPPSGLVTVDSSYAISWVGNDPDDDAIIELYYDDDNIGFDGISIDTSNQYPSGIVDNNGASQSYDWDTSALSDGSSFYIYAKIEDDIHAPVYSYSQGKIEIDHPNILPIVEITSPTGGSVSSTKTIAGTASDPDGAVNEVYVKIDGGEWLLATGTTSWSYDWDTTMYSNDQHTIYAKAYDGEDFSDEVSTTVNVDNGGNEPPIVTITSPSGGDVSGEITISGTASDSDGSIQLVEVQIGDEGWIEVEGTTSWNYDWDTTMYSNAEYMIKARAKDDTGEYSQEDTITVIVDNGGNILPTVEISSHSGGEILSGSVTIQGSAIDHDGTVEKVEVKIDDGTWGEASGTASWSYEWNTTLYSNGEHLFYARAKDDLGEYSPERSITLIVDNGGNMPPVVSITKPVEGTVSGLVIISGTAYDLDESDTISKVEVKIDNGNWLVADGTTDWSYDWDTLTLDDGHYIIFVRAFDGTDYSLVKSVMVNVDNPHEPVLTVTSDVPKTASGTITLSGSASDADGEITKVEIQIDDGDWEEAEGTTSWSYELDTTKLSNGDHTIRIRVYDDEGNYHVETLTLDVKNEEDSLPLIWLVLLGVLVIVILLIIGLSLRKGKSPEKIAAVPVQVAVAAEPQVQTQELRCPGCGNVFQAEVSSGVVQCPHCGVSGNVGS